jgi:hypothetical protein
MHYTRDPLPYGQRKFSEGNAKLGQFTTESMANGFKRALQLLNKTGLLFHRGIKQTLQTSVNSEKNQTQTLDYIQLLIHLICTELKIPL